MSEQEQQDQTQAPSQYDEAAQEPEQPVDEQSDEQESSGARFAGQAEVPDLDPETSAAVTPRPAVAVNPGESYNDDLAGKPEDAEQSE